ncbi:hypothetical protein HMPREF1624_02886 [Sporothrix schenckii ATCC 58251]|uniref:Uncharacterized protein n=1 Tax=Sporothrix schenckii (strain ATCC 58251 / de Perez 2211183) TaxID=1391915 RepID=U7Q149_SPOS1|nr:hypothetical protein HMPREF1624_02886 [Sporothrix schenckii ATCC 58251]
MADEVQEAAKDAHMPSKTDDKDNDASSINEATRGDNLLVVRFCLRYLMI